MADYYISSTKYSIQTRQTKKNGTVYDVVFRIIEKDGTEKQKKLSGFANKTKAKQAYTSFVTERCELVKNNPLKKKKPDKEKLLVGDLYLSYIASQKGQIKDSTAYDRSKTFNKYVMPVFGSWDIKSITPADLYKWQDGLLAMKNPKTGKFYSDARIEATRHCFNVFLNWCEDRYKIPNPLKNVKAPKKRSQQRIMNVWKREEFERFISVVDDPTYHLLFTLLFFTGRRRGEVLALSPDDINMEKGVIRFNKAMSRKSLAGGAIWQVSSTKANKSAEIPMCTPVKKELERYTPAGAFLIGGDRPIPANTIDKRFSRYVKQSGVPKIRLHDLRHSYVSMLIHLGANVAVVADLISDTQEQVMETYSHFYEEDKAQVLSRIT